MAKAKPAQAAQPAAAAPAPAAPAAAPVASPEVQAQLQDGETPQDASKPAAAATDPAVAEKPGTETVSAQAEQAKGPPEQSDAEFVLRTFGVNPRKYVKGGALDREQLDLDVDAYRPLFANRILHGRFA